MPRPSAALAALAAALLGALGVGCGAGFALQGNAAELVRIRAPKDLSCPDKDVTVTPEWGGKYTAIGCGRTASYHSMCQGLHCKVGLEGEEPQPWRDRPTPEEPEAGH
ncbi:MAG: hypothetical protein HY908_09200 [Myxococcales bacterium]|nr:hypothetical protein [Myxococcales bacterium]